MLTVKDALRFFALAKEHYEISDEFVRSGYQQSPKSGYVKFANRTGHIVDKALAEPNQKWHLMESYMIRSFADGTVKPEDDMASIYAGQKGLKCPELLLWIAEAAGVDRETVQDAAKAAKRIIDGGENGYARNTAGIHIRNNYFPWETLEEKIKASL